MSTLTINQIKNNVNRSGGKSDKKSSETEDLFSKENLWKTLGMNSSVHDMLSISYQNGDLVSRTFESLVINLAIMVLWIDKRKYQVDFLIDKFRDLMPDFEALEKQFLESKKEDGSESFMDALQSMQSEFFGSQSTASKMTQDKDEQMREMRDFLMKKNNEKPIVQEISERQVDEVREKVRSDVQYDMKAEVNDTVARHATNINLTQIQKIKQMDNDSLRTEINELKRLLTKNIEETQKLDTKCQEYDNKLPRLDSELGTIRAEINGKASRDELQNLQNGQKDFASTQLIEVIQDKLDSKASFQDINQVNIAIEDINMKMSDKINYMDFNSYKDNNEKKLVNMNNESMKKDEFIIQKAELIQSTTNLQEKFDKFQDTNLAKFESTSRSLNKLESKFNYQAEKDVIYEIRSQIMDLAHKEQLNEIENKMMPLIEKIVFTTKNFEENISDMKSKQIRIDELLLDKCSKQDIKKLYKKMESMVDAEMYQEFCDSQNKINDKLITSMKNTESQFKINDEVTEFMKERMETLENDITEIKSIQSETVSPEDISSLRDQLQIKVDRHELNKLQEMKSNKDDMNLVINAVNHVHRQLEMSMQISLATVRGFNLYFDDRNQDKNHRLILQNHTKDILTYICSQNIIDCIKSGKFDIPKNLVNLSSFALKNSKKDNNSKSFDANNDQRRSTENNYISDFDKSKNKFQNYKDNNKIQFTQFTQQSINGVDVLDTQATNQSFSSPREYRVQSQQSQHRVVNFGNNNNNAKQKLPSIKLN